MAAFAKKPLRWLWPRCVPLGKLTVLSGDPNLGKSLVTLDVAARVSRGRGFPVMPLRGERMSREESARRRALREAVRAKLAGAMEGNHGDTETGRNEEETQRRPAAGSRPPESGGVGERALRERMRRLMEGDVNAGSESGETFGPEMRRGREACAEQEVGGVEGEVLLLSAEDDVGDTIRPRLEAAGADVSRVHIFRGMQRGARRRFVALERDLEAIRKHLRESGRYRLVVIDPISAYLARISHRA